MEHSAELAPLQPHSEARYHHKCIIRCDENSSAPKNRVKCVLHIVVAATELLKGGGEATTETNLHFRALSHAFADTHTGTRAVPERPPCYLFRTHPLGRERNQQ